MLRSPSIVFAGILLAGLAANLPAQSGSRFKVYPPESIARGETAYASACQSCHGLHAKGANAPDLIRSSITMHDEDGVSYAQYLKGDAHSKAAKLDLPQNQVADIASYLHDRVIQASGRGQVHLDKVVTGDAKAGEAFFNGAGGCAKCHSLTGNLKGIGAKYDAATLQDRIFMPARANFPTTGRGAIAAVGVTPSTALIPKATVTTADGKTFTGVPMRNTDFDITLRFEDGTTRTWARENGVPKVTLTDPLQAHLDLMTKMTDTNLHNLTAFLVTQK